MSMTVEIRILSGACSGRVVTLAGNAVVGRQADVDLRLDPVQDLEVSGRHAIIGLDAARWFVRDLDSRNGTFVNGERVHERVLHDGDRIMFGWRGPEVEIRLGAEREALGVPPTRGMGALDVGLTEARRENVRLRRVTMLLAFALAALSVGSLWFTRQQRIEQQMERRNLMATVDRVLATSDSTVRQLAGERQALGAALRRSQTEVREVRDRLQTEGASRDTAHLPDLRRQLQVALAALERQQLAAALDFESIERASRSAVAVIWVETAAGEVRIGTGFAVSPDATLVTNRHVLLDEHGRSPRRVAAQFSDSDQVFPARVVKISDDADLAVIKVDNIIGDVPVVRGLNARTDTLRAGAAIAWIGFPFGGETGPQDARTGRVARPLGAAGIVMSVGRDEFEIQGYGAAGVSGSPVFDALGEVVAVLYGGRKGDAGQVLYAVPISKALPLLAGRW